MVYSAGGSSRPYLEVTLCLFEALFEYLDVLCYFDAVAQTAHSTMLVLVNVEQKSGWKCRKARCHIQLYCWPSRKFLGTVLCSEMSQDAGIRVRIRTNTIGSNSSQLWRAAGLEQEREKILIMWLIQFAVSSANSVASSFAVESSYLLLSQDSSAGRKK